MKTSNSKFILWAMWSVLIGFMPLSNANANLVEPQVAIATASNQLKVKMQEAGFTQDFQQITQFVESVIYPSVDFDRISALVLGKHWKTATSEQKSRFKTEFKTLLVRTYSRAFVDFKDWSVRFLPINMDANSRKVIVKTEILQPGLQPIAVNYRMLLSKGQWKAYDIMIEGVSLVTNYRTSFKNQIQRNGLAATLSMLSQKNQDALNR